MTPRTRPKSESGLYWGNLTTALRWNHLYGNKLFSNVSLIYSNYKFNTFDDTQTLVNGKYDLGYSYNYYFGYRGLGRLWSILITGRLRPIPSVLGASTSTIPFPRGSRPWNPPMIP